MMPVMVTALLLCTALACGADTADDLVLGRALAKNGDCTGAIRVLSKVVDNDPALAPQALLTMADCYKLRKKWPQAISCYSTLLTKFSGSVAPDREVKAWIMDCQLANNEPDKAFALRKELLKDYAQDAWRLYYILGRRYIWQHKHALAIAQLEKAVELSQGVRDARELVDAKTWLLACYVEEKEWDKAESLAQSMVKEYPESKYEWFYLIGRCQVGRQQYDEATKSLELAASTSPRNFSESKLMYKALLDCYESTGEPGKAIVLTKKLIEDYPKEPTWRWELASRYVASGEYVEAMPLLQTVIETSTAQWLIRSSQILLGQCLAGLDRADEGLKRIEEYYRNKPDQWDSRLLTKAAVLLYGQKDNSGCVVTLQELLAEVAAGKKSTLVLTARELMCKALEGSGQWTEAALVLEKMAAESKDPMWLHRAGQDYYKARDYTDARRAYKEVIERTGVPDAMRALCMHDLALCYWDSGLKNAARRLMERVADEYAQTETALKARGLLQLWSGDK